MSDPVICTAAYNRQLQIVQLLIANGARLDVVDEDGHTPLCNALMGRDDDVIQYILSEVRRQGVAIDDGSAMRLSILSREKAAQQQAAQAQPKKSGCYIATACYGDYDHPDVVVLRRFRDDLLLRSLAGRALVATYYTLSPVLARQIGANARLARGIRQHVLEPLVRRMR